MIITNVDSENTLEIKKEPISPRHTIATILEIKESEMNVSDIMGHTNTASPPTNDTNITLWQFLYELLCTEKHCDIIQWTRTRDGEFKLIDAEAVAKLWGQRKAKPHMNYDKLSRALRYYYEKNIIKKVIGQKFVYRFVIETDFPKKSVKNEKNESIYDFSSQKPVNSSNSPSSESACSPSSSVSSSSASLMLAHNSISPIPCTSSPQLQDISPTTPRDNRKRSHSPPSNGVAKSEPHPRRTKPNPLNLTAATNFMPPTTTNTTTFSPMLFLHQSSPLLQPAMSHLYAIASLASAGLYGPQMSPLLAAATANANSPFRSPLNTPKANGEASTQPQIFQFPPTSTSLINPFSGLVSPVAPFMISSPATNTFKFPSSESLKTPTVPLKMPSL